MGVMNDLGLFSCRLDLPVRDDEGGYKCIPIIGICRRVLVDQVDTWMMHPDGRPRSDQELASEVVVELRRQPSTTADLESLQLDIADVLGYDRAAAIIVAMFLAELPRG